MDPAAIEFFEKKVRPLLSAQCFACHSGANTRGDLDLTSREKLLTGGALGAAIVPGDPDKSLLIRAIRYEGSLQMPPRGKIPDEEIAVLTEWVKMGAPWGVEGSRLKVEGSDKPQPSTLNLQPSTRHWAFLPVRTPRVPAVKQRAWVKNPVDAFILAKLEAKGLRPSPPADRRTLIRRAAFDLTGLPPTPEEVEAFLADRSPDAWERVIDRLLASPAYGERWGRHWLDVVRYSDSNGLDWNEVFPNAWRYRDYVIRSFNEDKPYDRFIREQLAGDLLAEETQWNGETGGNAKDGAVSARPISSFPHSPISSREERLIATGMLVMGPKLLAQQDRIKLGLDVIDEQIDVTTKAFLGLTVSCARCHDHKFDPIPTRDYYALAGIFRSTVTLKGTLPRNDRVMYWNERPLAPPDRIEASQAFAAKVKAAEDAVKKAKDPAEKTRLTKELAELQKTAPPAVPMTMAVAEGKVANCAVHIRGSYANLGPEVPRGFVTVLGGAQRVTDTKQSGRRELADWIANPRNPLTARVLVNRVWLHHFGEGIVRTPDDFGTRGERPTHPELLDWLAAVFSGGDRGTEGQRDRGTSRGAVPQSLHPSVSPSPSKEGLGWSVKKLHRLLMVSSAYRMSSEPNAAASAKDPENRLLWRMNRVRLEAEAIRDAMLAASGSLEREAGGTMLTKASGFPVKEFPVNFNTRRRSVYLPALRVVTYDLLKVFDFAEPSIVIGKRNRTTVPTQALVMMNNPFVTQQSHEFAKTMLAQPAADDRQRVEAAYARALGRQPSSAEAGRVLSFIEDYDQALAETESDAEKRRAAAWASFCQTLFASTEFRYLD